MVVILVLLLVAVAGNDSAPMTGHEIIAPAGNDGNFTSVSSYPVIFTTNNGGYLLLLSPPFKVY